jgi:hypothetical protein
MVLDGKASPRSNPWRRPPQNGDAPGDAAKAAVSFEDEIMMRCLAHHIALAFRSTIELVRASREFNRILAFSVAAESMSAQEPGSLLTDVVRRVSDFSRVTHARIQDR